jgi:hypothetical protein
VAHGANTLRLTAALSAGVLAVHELRYRVGYGAHAEQAAAEHGHAYLVYAAPLVAVLLALAVAGLLRHAPSRPMRSRVRCAAVLSVALMTAYTGQELLEGLLAHGHEDGFAGVFGEGGWSALPLSMVLGGLLALVVVEAERLVASTRCLLVTQRIVCPDTSTLRLATPDVRRQLLLADHLAGRGPPGRFA